MTTKESKFCIPRTFNKISLQPAPFYQGRAYTLHRPIKEKSYIPVDATQERRKKEILRPSALNQARMLFNQEELDDTESLPYANRETNTLTRFKRSFSQRFSRFTIGSVEIQRSPDEQKPNNYSMEQSSQDSSNWTKTLRRGVKKVTNTVRIHAKNPTEISKHLENVKKLFQDSEYKKAKKECKKLENMDELKSSDIYLYLAAIYLLDNNGLKAKKYLEKINTSYLILAMASHAESFIKGDRFLQHEFYKVEGGFSENEEIIASKLFELAQSTQEK